MKTVIVDKLENLDQVIRNLDPEKTVECEQVADFFFLLPSVITPMTVTKAERPDFIIEAGGHKTGIEVTWSCHQGWEEAETYLGSSKNKNLSRISRNSFTGLDARGKELGRHLENKQGASLSWGSREMAMEWVNQILDSLSRKTDAFNKEGFQKFEINWLVVADKLPFEFLDLDTALEALNSKTECFEKDIPYSSVFITTRIRGKRILIGGQRGNFQLIKKAA